MTIARKILNGVSALRLRGRFAACSVGSGSRLDLWRVHPVGDNSLIVGESSQVSTRITFERVGSRMTVGARTFVGLGGVSVAVDVAIGDDVMVAGSVTIADHDSHSLRFSERSKDVQDWLGGRKDWTRVAMAPVRIGNRAWIGMHSIILKGITVGEGAVVAAGSVVTRSVAPWTLVAGNPAKAIRDLEPS